MAKSQEDFIAKARLQFEQDMADERPLRTEAELDLKFVAGEQWDETLKSQRIKNGRPAMTFNRCHTFVQQVANEARQNKPQIKFIPAEESDKDTAEVYEGLARHIQYDSDAQIAYETAVEYSAGGSFGYFRFLTDYCDDESFDQDLKVVPVYDPFSVYGVLIPSLYGMEPKHAFVVEEMPKADYEAIYPDSELTKNWEGGLKYSAWVTTETVKIAEYWYVEETTEVLERDGKKRNVTRKKVKFCKMNGVEILPDSETEWPGYCIPIVPVLGKQMFINGKPKLFSVVRFQRDPQQLINYYKTRIAETCGTAPIQPYIVYEGQIAGHEREWAELNTTMRPFLTVKGTLVDGKVAPLPQRQVFEAPIGSLSEAAAQEIDDMKATTGIYDASLGNKSNESSGIALARRQQQSDVTNMHFLDNLERGFKKGGQIIADVLPVIYDTPRMVRILGEDEAPKVVKINQPYMEGDKPKNYKIGGDGIGKYDVLVTMGRSFSTKRMESFDMMGQVIQANPQILPMIGDIFFRNSDLAGADQLAERFKKMLPPNLQDEEEGQQPIPPQVQAQMQQMQQQMQQLNAYAQQKEQEVQDAKHDLPMRHAELQSKHEIEMARIALEHRKLDAQVGMKAEDLHTKESIAGLQVAAQMTQHNQQLDAQQVQQAQQAAEQPAE
jgi:hypothetical protein